MIESRLVPIGSWPPFWMTSTLQHAPKTYSCCTSQVPKMDVRIWKPAPNSGNMLWQGRVQQPLTYNQATLCCNRVCGACKSFKPLHLKQVVISSHRRVTAPPCEWVQDTGCAQTEQHMSLLSHTVEAVHR